MNDIIRNDLPIKEKQIWEVTALNQYRKFLFKKSGVNDAAVFANLSNQ